MANGVSRRFAQMVADKDWAADPREKREFKKICSFKVVHWMSKVIFVKEVSL
jgi:hypothetical protein